MKLADFYPLCREPAIYEVDYERLRTMPVEVSDAEFHEVPRRSTYGELRDHFLEEGVVEANWSDSQPTLTTKRTTYRYPHAALPDTPFWKLLCLDCHLTTKLDSHIAWVKWFQWLRYSEHDFEPVTGEKFFVVAGDLEPEIIDEEFRLLTFGVGPSGSEGLIRNGVWREVRPKELDKSSRIGTAWDIGWHREKYHRFYDGTATGRICSMVPNGSRLDDLRFWVEVPTEPNEPTPSEVLLQVHSISARLQYLQAMVLFATFGGIALAVACWLRQ